LVGLGYQVAADTGKLVGMIARNGNTLTFSDAGITSNTARRSASRATQPDTSPPLRSARQLAKYAYDVNGNLISVTDRAGHDPQYTYDPNHPHYLLTAVDVLGVQQLHVTYDTTGRVTQLTDAKQNSINLAYNTTARTETVTDPNLPSGSQNRHG